MSCSTREEIVEVFDDSDALLDRKCALTFDALAVPELMRAVDRLERAERQSRVVRHALINELAARGSKEELGDTLATALADRLRITKAEASRWIAEAADLGERRSLTGERLEPQLTATATGQRDGLIGDGHVKVIRGFLAHLPADAEPGTREHAEADLADKARDYRPDQVAKYAREVMALLHPDGDYSDEERARKRGLALGNQEFDGMSRISGLITPELRAAIEAMLAKLAAPGVCNPEDHAPIVDDEPDPEAVRRDTRSAAQRNHDGLLAGVKDLMASGRLGKHNGLPVTIVVTATLENLEAATGTARTGGGSLVPMSDVIRWSGSAHHYLALFDGAKPLALYHRKRLANTAQRIMLYARDGGCTRPGCDAPAYHSQVHHVSGWTNTHRTHINDLALACGVDNRLAESGWTTRTNAKGHVEWLPPAHLDQGQPRINTFHRPEKLFRDDDDDEPD